MRTLTSLLPSLTCVGGMAACMWLMSRRHGGRPADVAAGDGIDAHSADVAQLSDEVARLRAELDARTPERAP